MRVQKNPINGHCAPRAANQTLALHCRGDKLPEDVTNGCEDPPHVDKQSSRTTKDAPFKTQRNDLIRSPRVNLHQGIRITARAILFDMDGTLLCSRGRIEMIWRTWAQRVLADPNEVVRFIDGRRAIDVVRRFAPTRDPEAEARVVTQMGVAATSALTPVRGALEFVCSIKSDQWAVVTSAAKGLAERWLALSGFPTAPILIGAEEVNVGKPDPQCYTMAMERLGVHPADALIFEDSDPGLQAALASKGRVVAVGPTRPQSYGGDLDWIEDFAGLMVSSMEDGTLMIGQA